MLPYAQELPSCRGLSTTNVLLYIVAICFCTQIFFHWTEIAFYCTCFINCLLKLTKCNLLQNTLLQQYILTAPTKSYNSPLAMNGLRAMPTVITELFTSPASCTVHCEFYPSFSLELALWLLSRAHRTGVTSQREEIYQRCTLSNSWIISKERAKLWEPKLHENQ